jgi:hypothetical protein
VKRVSADDQAVIFQLSLQEHEALLDILQTYPVVPPAHQSVSKDLKDPHTTDYQHLLDEALAEQRIANQKHLHAWLATAERFKRNKTGFRFTLERTDSEWLLQVLNDIRVGHWLQLGSPETSELKPQHLDAKRLPAWLKMEMSGYFQMSFLEALES